MTSLSQLCTASLEGTDWIQRLADDASIAHALDAFFSRACAVQSRRIDLQSLTTEEQQGLHDDARTAFALYVRAQRALEGGPLKGKELNAMRATVLHVTRFLPFCQLYASRSPQQVHSILEATTAKVDETKTDIARLARVFVEHLDQVHQTSALNKRGQVVDLIQSIYETVLSIQGLSLCPAVLDLLFGESESDTLASGSLARALAVCYEVDVALLQRSLSKLDEKAQKKVALLIPEVRRVMLHILDAVFQVAMTREKSQGGTGEGVLTIIHELSNSTDAETADHGSYISDLWHLCSYEAKLLEFFDDIKLDRDSVSYLEVILDGLPRRKIILDSAALHVPDKGASEDASPSQFNDPSTTADISSLVSQVQDLFPNLEDGYIALCLLCSQNQLETVINYLLEDNPPPAVGSIRTSLKRTDSDYPALERKVLGKEEPVPASSTVRSEKIDPGRIWVGKRTQEKNYDPRVARKDPSIVEKVKEIVDEYAEQDMFREAAKQHAQGNNATSDGGGRFILDEYDDDYNDEFEDYEPFGVHDGGQAEDFDAIRLQNRRLRELEAEDAFWDGMRNQNRRALDTAQDDENDEGGDEDESKEEISPWARGSARGESASPGGITSGNRSSGPPRRPKNQESTGPLTEQQVQRQRRRDNMNKAKVGNHNRKDRALKKRG